MTLLILLLLVAAALAAATVRLALHDGHGPAAPPSSRHDPTFRSPTTW